MTKSCHSRDRRRRRCRGPADDLARALDPAGLMAQALWIADRDAGGGLIAALDRLDIVNEISWPYPDPCATVADRLGHPRLDAALSPGRRADPDAADARGRDRDRARRDRGGRGVRRRGRGQRPPRAACRFRAAVAAHDPRLQAGARRPTISPRAARALDSPARSNVIRSTSATAARMGRRGAKCGGKRGDARNAAIAATRPAAWIRRDIGAPEIVSPDAGNRPIAWPHPASSWSPIRSSTRAPR
ncbi:hypothetical protein AB5I41_08800 [Sphingomonas sp. MMS24-JH45]